MQSPYYNHYPNLRTSNSTGRVGPTATYMSPFTVITRSNTVQYAVRVRVLYTAVQAVI